MVRHVVTLLLLAVVLACGPARAVEPDEVLKDPALEARARHLSAELRCMVCQNQSIDDSDAPLAKDLRILVRERLVAGDTDVQVKQYLTARYGDFVLLRPPFDWRTALPWTAPFLILVAGAVGVLVAARRRKRSIAGPVPLSDEEARQLARIMDGEGEDGTRRPPGGDLTKA
jgi:cytochrome c-type biogenesis protein CcmH